MPTFGLISPRELIYYLKKLGFERLLSGSKHQYMIKDDIVV